MTTPSSAHTANDLDERLIGARIRALRTGHGLSLRALASRLDISASALSQIERGKMRPSVTRLYQITSELGEPMSAVFGDDSSDGAPGGEPHGESDRTGGLDAPPESDDADGGDRVGGTDISGSTNSAGPSGASDAKEERAESSPLSALPEFLSSRVAVTRSDKAAVITLGHGVRYRRLTPEQIPGISYFESTYPPGAYSSQDAEFVRHTGHEIGLVVSGELVVDTGFDSHRLGPGDTISFPSTTPHRISNQSDLPAVAIWLNLP